MSIHSSQSAADPEQGDAALTIGAGGGSNLRFPKKLDAATHLMQSINGMRKAGQLCDLVLEVGATQFRCHQLVACVWSPVLRSMLMCQNQGRQTGDDGQWLGSPVMSTQGDLHVQVDYADVDVFEQFVNYLYTGEVPAQAINMPAVLLLAASFNVRQLLDYCEAVLQSTLTVESLLSIHRLAIRFSLNNLATDCVHFLCKYAADIAQMSEFQELAVNDVHALLGSPSMHDGLVPEVKLFLIISWLGEDLTGRQQFLVGLLAHIDWAVVAADFLIEISRGDNFFTCHPSALYLLLQTLHSSGISLGPYAGQFEGLRLEYGHVMASMVVATGASGSEGIKSFQPVHICLVDCNKGKSVLQHKGSEADNSSLGLSTEHFSTEQAIHHPEETYRSICNVNTMQESKACELDSLQNEANHLVKNTPKQDRAWTRGKTQTSSFETHSPLHDCPAIPSESDRAASLEDQETSDAPPLVICCETNTRRTGLRSRKSAETNKAALEVDSKKKINGKEPEKESIRLKINLKKVNNFEMVAENSVTTEVLKNDLKQTVGQNKSDQSKQMEKRKQKESSCGTIVQSRSGRKFASPEKGKAKQHDMKNFIGESEADKPGESIVKKKKNDQQSNIGETSKNNFVPTKTKRKQQQKATKPKSKEKKIKNVDSQDVLDDSDGLNLLIACDLCSFTTKVELRYYQHLAKTHFPGSIFPCDREDCSFKTHCVKELAKHRIQHNNLQPYVCTICLTVFQRRNSVLAHMKVHSDDRKFVCDDCGLTFKRKINLQQHRVTHSDNRPYLCDLCGFSTKYHSHLISHKKIHAGNVFRCDFPACTYSTPRQPELKAHMRYHLGIRTHICSTCGKGFVNKSHLVRHERIHSASKSLVCPDCPFVTTRLDKLKQHRAKHHDNKDQQDKVTKGTARKTEPRPGSTAKAKGQSGSTVKKAVSKRTKLKKERDIGLGNPLGERGANFGGNNDYVQVVVTKGNNSKSKMSHYNVNNPANLNPDTAEDLPPIPSRPAQFDDPSYCDQTYIANDQTSLHPSHISQGYFPQHYKSHYNGSSYLPLSDSLCDDHIVKDSTPSSFSVFSNGYLPSDSAATQSYLQYPSQTDAGFKQIEETTMPPSQLLIVSREHEEIVPSIQPLSNLMFPLE